MRKWMLPVIAVLTIPAGSIAVAAHLDARDIQAAPSVTVAVLGLLLSYLAVSAAMRPKRRRVTR